jgi:hypothetical protein
MKRKFLLHILGLFLVFVFAGNIWAADDSRYPVMRPDLETWIKWMNDYETAPKAKIDEEINFMLYQAQSFNYGTSMDLLGHIDYDPIQRSQGTCGNCWAWAGTGLMEIAHDVQDGVFDRLSIQYINSCRAPGYGCCGNNIGTFATWYAAQGMAIPWGNTNASFADGTNCCRDGDGNPCPPAVTCLSISTTPNYPITSISESRIPTTSFWDGVDQATAIVNIKNALNQDEGVYFGFALPNSTAWGDFFDFWACDGGETEATLWDHPDDYCGIDWNNAKGEGGGHAVVILGYNDDDADPANHYWLALNSWATAGGNRPNGLFRIPTQMNYSCFYPIPNTDPQESIAAFVFYILDVDFGNSPPIADANGPYTVECEGTTTTIVLDGTGSSDPEGTALTYAWSTDCPDGIFNDPTSATPVLTVSTSGCYVTCSVTLTVTDGDGATDDDTAPVTITDTTPPDITCPADVTIECDEQTDPDNTGSATATDICNPSPVITYSDVEAPGDCAAEKTITRTWTATDVCGNTHSCVQTIKVVDTTPPVIACNAPATITPPDAPISFTATATDNCDDDPSVEITRFDCFKFTKKGKQIDKTESCIVDVCGNTITILDSGGVGTQITWTVRAVDECENPSEFNCMVDVVKKGKP